MRFISIWGYQNEIPLGIKTLGIVSITFLFWYLYRNEKILILHLSRKAVMKFPHMLHLLSKFESVKIYWLSVKVDWFKQLKSDYCKSVKFHWLFQWKLTDLTVKNIFFTDESLTISWWISQKENHWFNQWKFDWFRIREYIT